MSPYTLLCIEFPTEASGKNACWKVDQLTQNLECGLYEMQCDGVNYVVLLCKKDLLDDEFLKQFWEICREGKEVNPPAGVRNEILAFSFAEEEQKLIRQN